MYKFHYGETGWREPWCLVAMSCVSIALCLIVTAVVMVRSELAAEKEE